MKATSHHKIFVLDTSVLLFDHNAINNFQDNDIVIPITVLEELDNFKIGNETKNFEARAIIRFLDKVSKRNNLNEGISLGENKGKLKIVMESPDLKIDAETIYGKNKNDHKIMNVALWMQQQNTSSKVFLITKDINLRIKAKSIGLFSDDYLTGKVENIKTISESSHTIEDVDPTEIKNLYQHNRIDENGILKDNKTANGYYILNNLNDSVLARYNKETNQLERVEKTYAYGIKT